MFGFASPNFDIDARTGFLPGQAPLRRLTGSFERWELLLDDALSRFVSPGACPLISKAQVAFADLWQKRIRKVSHSTYAPPCHTSTRMTDHFLGQIDTRPQLRRDREGHSCMPKSASRPFVPHSILCTFPSTPR
jgi:hypothetical protein